MDAFTWRSVRSYPNIDIIEIGKREGWRAIYCSRGSFDVVEFWIENSLMIEFLDPDMQAQYKALLKGRADQKVVAPAL